MAHWEDSDEEEILWVDEYQNDNMDHWQHSQEVENFRIDHNTKFVSDNEVHSGVNVTATRHYPTTH